MRPNGDAQPMGQPGFRVGSDGRIWVEPIFKIMKTTKIFLAALALAFLGSCGASKETSNKPAAAQVSPAATLQTYAAPEAKIGDRVICPATGDAFTVAANSPVSVIKGKKYFYCCGDCKTPVEKNPDAYLKTGKAPGASGMMGHGS